MGWSLIPGDPSPAPLTSAGGVPSQGWAASGVQSFGANSAATAFNGPTHGHAPGSQVSIVPDANGLLPGQTKFYTPPPALNAQGQVISSVDANGAPIIQPTLSISRAALPALQAQPSNAFTAGLGHGNNGSGLVGGGSGGNRGGGAAGGSGAAGSGGGAATSGGDESGGTRGF